MTTKRAPATRAEPFASIFRAWEWQEAAACRGTDTDLFFGAEHETALRRANREARVRAMCAGCPVRRTCLQFALDHRIQYGVWGGRDETQRTVLLKRLRQKSDAAWRPNNAADRSPLSPNGVVAETA